MNGHLDIPTLKKQLGIAAKELVAYCSQLPDEQFFYQPAEKWSAAQQVHHLITATKAASMAYTLPKWMVRMVAGKPNRPSRTYDELVAKYKAKIAAGGKASARFVPKPVPSSYGKQKLLDQFMRAMLKMAAALEKKFKEDQPDKYIAPHPLLGKITLRELAYFTIYHTGHHLASIRSIQSL